MQHARSGRRGCIEVAAASVAPVDFAKDVPRFSSELAKRHGAEKQKGDFRLDVKDVALKAGRIWR